MDRFPEGSLPETKKINPWVMAGIGGMVLGGALAVKSALECARGYVMAGQNDGRIAFHEADPSLIDSDTNVYNAYRSQVMNGLFGAICKVLATLEQGGELERVKASLNMSATRLENAACQFAKRIVEHHPELISCTAREYAFCRDTADHEDRFSQVCMFNEIVETQYQQLFHTHPADDFLRDLQPPIVASQ